MTIKRKIPINISDTWRQQKGMTVIFEVTTNGQNNAQTFIINTNAVYITAVTCIDKSEIIAEQVVFVKGCRELQVAP